MSDFESDATDRAFGAAVAQLGPRLLAGLAGLERAFRQLHPPAMPDPRAADSSVPDPRMHLAPLRATLEEALAGFNEIETPASLEAFRDDLVAAGEQARDAIAGLVDPAPPEQAMARALGAMHAHARAQALLYPLRGVLPPVSAFFAETSVHDRLSSLEAPETRVAGEGQEAKRVGLFRSGEPGARGGFDLYVPESYDDVGSVSIPGSLAVSGAVSGAASGGRKRAGQGSEERFPLIVALHGGAGNGADFIWTWLREARSRRCVLLAPTSQGSTWSLHAPAIDGVALERMVEGVASRWRIDRERILLTGLSDGATMTLLVGAAEGAPYTHLAPVSGVLHPMNFANGNLDRVQEKPIYLVHGTLDWMFPVTLAREAARVLEDAGAALVFREIEDLSHTYPREENARILDWIR